MIKALLLTLSILVNINCAISAEFQSEIATVVTEHHKVVGVFSRSRYVFIKYVPMQNDCFFGNRPDIFPNIDSKGFRNLIVQLSAWNDHFMPFFNSRIISDDWCIVSHPNMGNGNKFRENTLQHSGRFPVIVDRPSYFRNEAFLCSAEILPNDLWKQIRAFKSPVETFYKISLPFCFFGSFPSRISAALGMFRSASGKDSGSNGSAQGQYAYRGANYTDPESISCPTGGISSGICRLPLSAKIGITVVLTWLAWLSETVWLFLTIKNPRKWIRYSYLFVIGWILFFSPAALWW